MLNIEKADVKAKIYGEVYNLRLPTVREAQKYGKIASELGEKEVDKLIDSAINLLDTCGLPKKVCEEMTVDHMMQVVSVLIPSKKK